MIQKCDKCWTSYNPQTIDHCPGCGLKKVKKEKSTEALDFMRSEIAVKKRLVNSTRASDVSKAEREKGIQVYQSRA